MSENAHVLPFNPFHALPDPPAMLYSNSFVNTCMRASTPPIPMW